MASALASSSMTASLDARAFTDQRICKSLPHHLILARAQRPAQILCHGLALPAGLNWPLGEIVDRIMSQHRKRAEGKQKGMNAANLRMDNTITGGHQLPLRTLVSDATASLLHAGLVMTGIALRLAKRVVEDMRHSLSCLKISKPRSRARASELMRDAQAQLIQQAQRQELKDHARDAAFMQMLQNLDRCHMNHDEKWALFTKLSADKLEFSKRWQHLYDLAMASKAAVDTLLRPDASRSEINSFWRSEETSAIIAKEDALKQLVFAQVFQAGGK